MTDVIRNFLRRDTSQNNEAPTFVLQKPEDVDIDSIHEISIENVPEEARSKLELEADKGYVVSRVHSLSLGEDRTVFIVLSEDKTNPKTNRHIVPKWGF